MSLLPATALSLAVLSAVLAAAVPIYYGRRKPGYSHLRHTISELGEIGSPVGESVSYLGFISIGVSLWLFLIVAAKLLPSEADVFFLLSLIGAGYVGGGIFRCDPDAPFTGSWRTTLHNVFGALEYLGAAAAFLELKRSEFWSPLSDVMSFAGGLVLFCLPPLSFPHPLRGLIQRIAETTIFGGVVLVGWWVYRASA
jgi:uncharacterized protein DUF998